MNLRYLLLTFTSEGIKQHAAEALRAAAEPQAVQPGAGARLNGAASERAACTAACAGRTRG